MATTATIIDWCLQGIGESTTAPVEMTRAEVLAIINELYQNDIGERLKLLASYSYDASDAAHTITAGVGTLPSDFLGVSQVYDGDAPDDEPLTQIFRIKDRLAATDTTSQYMLPDNTYIWFFGTTPTNTPKMYYYRKPVALTDSSSSSPTDLPEKFHRDVFVARVKYIYAKNQNNTYDMMDMLALVQDYLDEIEATAKKVDDTPMAFTPYF